MNLEEIFWVAMAVLVVVILPIGTVISVRQHLRARKRGEEGRSGGRAFLAIGNALQELDRLVARPSVEFTVEAEQPIVKREDDQEGD